MQYFVDTHCHLNDEDFETDLDEVLSRAKAGNIARMMVVGTDELSSTRAVELAEKHPYYGLYASVGVHPHDSISIKDGLPDRVHQLSSGPVVRAIGETGLDYHYDHSPRDIQKISFAWHVDLAKQLNKPLIVHIREAYDDSMDILKREEARECGGVIHCFSGSWENAVAALDMGFYISFAGPLTYPRNHELRDVATRIPLENLLCETDSPYLAPQGKRGKRNEPANVKNVFEMIAELRGLDMETLQKAVWDNSCKLFKWGE
jgi:TatD DNase family protein